MAKLLTVDEAAAAGWGHRAALYRAIKKGRIDAVGRRPAMLETCELERVYGAPKVRPDHVDDIELDRLRRENRRLRGDLDGERRRGTRLREMAAGFARTGELPPAPLWRLWSWLHGYDEYPLGRGQRTCLTPPRSQLPPPLRAEARAEVPAEPEPESVAELMEIPPFLRRAPARTPADV